MSIWCSTAARTFRSATLPGMRERCLRIGSAGKIFSLTGWKVGWVTGPRQLVAVATKAHQFITFTTPPALQLGVAHGLTHEMDFPHGPDQKAAEEPRYSRRAG